MSIFQISDLNSSDLDLFTVSDDAATVFDAAFDSYVDAACDYYFDASYDSYSHSDPAYMINN